jgi:CelD/BcsL family acetyltransferase involved in cellulose biosynthesis
MKAEVVDLAEVEIEVEVIEDSRGFAALEEEWEDLHRHCPRATPFQSWAWLYSWWEFYGDDYELRLVTVRDGGLLVGIVPLMLKPQMGFGTLLFIGTGLVDNLDMLARDGWEGKVSEAGVRVLKQMRSWRVADLQQVRSDAAAWGMFRRWDGHRTDIQQDGCPIIDVQPCDDLFALLSRNLRSTVRRALRRAEADGVRSELASVADAEQAARRLVSLHRKAWQGKDIVPEHLTRRFEAYIIAAARRTITRGSGGISEFWRNGEVVISYYWVSKEDSLGIYVLGASPEAIQRYQWSSLLIWDALNMVRNKNARYLDLLRGEEPYKLRWSSRVIPTHRMILGRRRFFWLPYAAYQVSYARARRYANSGDAAPWIKSAADRYRALRATRSRVKGERS